ncbi:MAG TPA: DUF11 domain-containing protein [Candidatus Udaeobacter sp.]|nr:DUF11 domain-containing protein [Candidatus Udaeobacter sp.]
MNNFLDLAWNSKYRKQTRSRFSRIAGRFVTLLFAAGLAAIPETAFCQHQKADPAGIIRLFSTDVANPEDSPSWTNPNIDGMRLRPVWSDVQSTQATLDWSSIDEIMELATEHGKFIGLSVTAGVTTPQWVYDAGATKYHLQDGSERSMPIPWDDKFLTQWSGFVRAMGQRYDGNPTLGYIVMSGFGQAIETRLAETDADVAALTARGGMPSWISAAQQLIRLYADAFPTTPFFITAANPFGLSNAEGLAALQQIIDWGVANYPGRFGIMNATLNANSNTLYYPNLAIYTYYRTQPTGFQTLCSAARDPRRLGGTLEQALMAGVQLGAKFVEVYQLDADDPANQEVLATQGAALEANASPAPSPSPTASPSTDLTITITDNETTAVAGARKNPYVIVVRNSGPSTIGGAVVRDLFPATFADVTFTATQNGGVSGYTASGAGDINDTLTMPIGSFVTYRARGTLRSSATGTISNTASVTPPDGVIDPNLGNNSASDTDTITRVGDLQARVTDGTANVVPGRQYTYRISVSNTGPSDVSGAVIRDSFPNVFTGVSFTATQTGGASGFTANGTGDINDTVTLPADSTIVYSATGTVSPSAEGTMSDTVTVSAPQGVTDPSLGNNSATDTDTIR